MSEFLEPVYCGSDKLLWTRSSASTGTGFRSTLGTHWSSFGGTNYMGFFFSVLEPDTVDDPRGVALAVGSASTARRFTKRMPWNSDGQSRRTTGVRSHQGWVSGMQFRQRFKHWHTREQQNPAPSRNTGIVGPVASQAHWHHGPSAGTTPDGYEKRRQTAHHTGHRPYVAAAGAKQEKTAVCAPG